MKIDNMAPSNTRLPAKADRSSVLAVADIGYTGQADVGAAKVFWTEMGTQGLHAVASAAPGMRIVWRGRSARRTAIVALAFALALSGSAAAHTDAVAEPAPDNAVREVQPISEGDVPARADTVSADLRRIERFIVPQPGVVRIESWLDLREARVVALLADLDRMADADISTRRLSDQRVPWEELREELAHWSGTVQGRYSALQAQRERLREERELWELTARRAIEDELAPELHLRVEAILERIRDVETRVRARRNEVGAIDDRITNTAEVVAIARARLDAAAEGMRRSAFEHGAEPLWRGLGTGGPRTWLAELASGSTYWWSALHGWVALERTPLFGLTALFVVACVAAARLRHTAVEPVSGRGPFRSVRSRSPFSCRLSSHRTRCPWPARRPT